MASSIGGNRMVGKIISHYKILEKIGGGGMGVVYKAEDIKLKRIVALKFLPHEFSDDVTAKKRFIQEAQSASSLDHPNICTIHEISETDEGQLFIAMACYEGETLKRKIEQYPPNIAEAITIAQDVAQGLAKAHSKGIVHRDIKPANIFLTNDGGVKILDFGLAKLAGTSCITKTESITGTVAYMSPEMVRADDVDHRTDIWSLGIVLYEMLTGQLPFKGDNWEATMFAISNTAPASVKQFRKDIPISLERIITKTLQKKSQHRYNDMQEVITQLQSIDLKAKNLLRVAPVKPSASIAVLPFIDMSPTKDQEYFCDGMAEELINSLTHIKDLRIVARTSAFSFKGKDVDVRDIGRTLNVDHVLEGSVRKSGDQLRITAQLVNVNDGYHLWSERYDRQADDVFTIQDEITLKIVDKLKVEIFGDEKISVQERHSSNINAYNAVLKARFFLQKFSKADLGKAIKYYQQAIDLDHNYALAYAAMSYCYCMYSNYYYLPSKDVLPKARIAAEKALEIDETLALAHSAIGYIHYLYDWDFDSARLSIEKALELEANCVSSRSALGGYFAAIGKTDRAIEEQKRALEIDPINFIQNVYLGLFYLWDRQPEAARQQLLKTREFSPEHPWALWLLATTYAHDYQYGKGIELLHQALNVAKDYPPVIAALGWFHAMSGDKKSARKILSNLKEKSKKSYIRPFLFAKIHAVLGENDIAFDWLEKAYQERDSSLSWLLNDESVDCVRDDPRFDELLKKIGLYKYKKGLS
ncbi:MAG: protein kinase [candidate division WOR-3 bacterium]|nr:MAG: protein kinase [candidate division WOR-3 bacterium]